MPAALPPTAAAALTRGQPPRAQGSAAACLRCHRSGTRSTNSSSSAPAAAAARHRAALPRGAPPTLPTLLAAAPRLRRPAALPWRPPIPHAALPLPRRVAHTAAQSRQLPGAQPVSQPPPRPCGTARGAPEAHLPLQPLHVLPPRPNLQLQQAGPPTSLCRGRRQRCRAFRRPACSGRQACTVRPSGGGAWGHAWPSNTPPRTCCALRS